jgi:phosphatidylinositol glycan class Z
LDWIVWKLSKEDPDAILTLATSWVMFSYILTPFSNTAEAIILAITIYIVLRTKGKSWHEYVLIGGLIAFGEFSRITFILYAFPLVLFLLYEELTKKEKDWASLLTGVLFGFSIVSAVIIIIDSVYFGTIGFKIADKPFRWLDLLNPLFYLNFLTNIGNLSMTSLTWTITPLNNFIYNSKTENLEEHGTHLRITHIFNLFVLYGPLAFVAIQPYYTWLDDQLGVMIGQLPIKKKEVRTVSKSKILKATGNTGKKGKSSIRVQEGKFAITKLAILGSILSAFIILSLIPHQEMRFLLPMLVPLVLLGYKGIFGNESFFWLKVGWIAFNILFAVFLGLFHQGGVVPVLLNLSQSQEPGTTQHIVFYHTYMPPQHLLAIQPAAKPTSSVTDLMGKPLTELRKALLRIPEQFNYNPKDKIFVVSPATVDLEELSNSLTLYNRQWFNWSGEEQPEYIFYLDKLFLNVYLYDVTKPPPRPQQATSDTTE